MSFATCQKYHDVHIYLFLCVVTDDKHYAATERRKATEATKNVTKKAVV